MILHFLDFRANLNLQLCKNGKKGFFSTGYTPGVYIIDATTGHINPDRYTVGSLNEDLFFKASFADGENVHSRTPTVVFFNSIEDFEQHTGLHCSDDVKNMWMEKCIEACRRLDFTV